MQFSLAIFAILPALAAAATPPPAAKELPSSNSACSRQATIKCPVSSDGLPRCLALGSGALCVIDCQSQSTCRAECAKKNFKNGFCTVGNNPCICSNIDGSVKPKIR